MNTQIVNCLDGTFDLVMTNDDKSKGVKKNFVFYDSINEDQETVLMAAFIHLNSNQWLTLEDDTLLEYPCYVNDDNDNSLLFSEETVIYNDNESSLDLSLLDFTDDLMWDNLTDGWDSF